MGQFLCGKDLNLFHEFTKCIKHRNIINIILRFLDHITTTTATRASHRRAAATAPLRSQPDIVDDSWKVFVHVPLRTEKVSHENQHPVETWKPKQRPLDGERTAKIWNNSVPKKIQTNARLSACIFAQSPNSSHVFTNQVPGTHLVLAPLVCFHRNVFFINQSRGSSMFLL
jgi:hypothetical protein